jgi:hypothetical protein
MKWSIPDSVRAYAGTSDKRHDKALAEELCDLQAVFWAPTSTWSWKSTSGSNRAGWMVQAISHREDDDVLLNVRSLHHSDHHKYGDIPVTSSHGRPSIRSIIQLHGARERERGLRISLSATEIGDPTAYPWVGKPPHTQATCPAPIATPRDQSPRPPNASQRCRSLLTPQVTFHTDMSALQVNHSERRHGERTVTVTVRKDQARLCFSSEEALHTRGTAAKPKRTRRTAGMSTTSKVRHCKDDSMVIEASRWAVLQTEATDHKRQSCFIATTRVSRTRGASIVATQA